MQHCLSAANRPEPSKPKIKVMIRLVGVCAYWRCAPAFTQGHVFSGLGYVLRKPNTPSHSPAAGECDGVGGMRWAWPRHEKSCPSRNTIDNAGLKDGHPRYVRRGRLWRRSGSGERLREVCMRISTAEWVGAGPGMPREARWEVQARAPVCHRLCAISN